MLQLLLLDASVATAANADSDLTPHQPCCGWDEESMHSFMETIRPLQPVSRS